MRIVIDKSYLQGVSADSIQALCKEHDAIMPEILYYELITADPEVRAACFRKICRFDSPMSLTTNSGALMRVECEMNRPCDPVKDTNLTDPYRFNDALGAPEFLPTQKDQEVITEWREVMCEEVESFKFRAGLVALFFPELKKLIQGSPLEAVESAMADLSGWSTKVLEIYEHISEELPFPRVEEIDENWAVYRTLQVQLMTAIEHIRKYGSGNLDAQGKRIENDVMDIEYCVQATLADGLASRDTRLKAIFERCKPDVYVIS